MTGAPAPAVTRALPAPRSPAWPEHVIEGGILFLLVFTPLAYGTVEPWSEALTTLVALALALTWGLTMLAHGEVRGVVPPGWLPAGLFLLLGVGQLVPLPMAFHWALSPISAEQYQRAASVLGTPARAWPLSLDPHATWRQTLNLLSVSLFFLVALNTCRTRARLLRVLWTLVIVGAAVALLGLAQRASWTGRLYWIGAGVPARTTPFGPFVNRAHFAGLMVIVIPMTLALFLAGAEPSPRSPRPARRGRPAAAFRLVLPFLALLMGAALLVSGSRGGLVSLGATLVTMTGLSVRGRAGRGRAVTIAAAGIGMLLVAVWIGADLLAATVARLSVEWTHPLDSPRLLLWADALRLWWQAPVFGTGLATFGIAYPVVRTVPSSLAFSHAESDWVQLLTDTGIVGLGLVLATGVALARRLWRRCEPSADRWAGSLALGGLAVLVGVAVHGVGNFNWPLVSLWVYLAAALAAGLAAPTPPGSERAWIASTA